MGSLDFEIVLVILGKSIVYFQGMYSTDLTAESISALHLHVIFKICCASSIIQCTHAAFIVNV